MMSTIQSSIAVSAFLAVCLLAQIAEGAPKPWRYKAAADKNFDAAKLDKAIHEAVFSVIDKVDKAAIKARKQMPYDACDKGDFTYDGATFKLLNWFMKPQSTPAYKAALDFYIEATVEEVWALHDAAEADVVRGDNAKALSTVAHMLYWLVMAFCEKIAKKTVPADMTTLIAGLYKTDANLIGHHTTQVVVENRKLVVDADIAANDKKKEHIQVDNLEAKEIIIK